MGTWAERRLKRSQKAKEEVAETEAKEKDVEIERPKWKALTDNSNYATANLDDKGNLFICGKGAITPLQAFDLARFILNVFGPDDGN